MAVMGLLLNKLQRIPYYAALARKYGFRFLVFEPQKINWEKGTVSGLMMQRGEWYKGEYPLPHAVYNRCYPEPGQVIRRLGQRLGHKSVFNSITLFDKWNVYEQLYKTPALQQYLPNTTRLVSQDIPELLAAGHKLVIKPRKGQSGRGLYLLAPSEGEFVSITSNMNIPLPLPLGEGLGALVDVLSGSEPYLAQSFVESASFDGGRFDVRFVVQKDKVGSWTITGELSRAAEPETFITNQYRALYHPRKTLQTLGKRGKAAYQEMKRISVQAAEQLDGKVGHLGEICVDFIVDPEGKPWIIEVNGKPDKGLFHELGDEEMLERIYLTPLTYLWSLSRYPSQNWRGGLNHIREYYVKLQSKEGPSWRT